MKILKNEELKNKTTIKIGGTASNFYIPETEEELIDLMKKEDELLFLGGGSNLLINDKKVFPKVVSLREFNKDMHFTDEGMLYVGASVSLQKLILFINENGYGGIEYLYSVPGLVGGSVCMNAGKGKAEGKAISDYLISVNIAKENGEIITLKKEECNFSYRNSRFKNSNEIVLSCIFKFPKQDKEISEKLRNERLAMCREKQDNSYPNFGSAFCMQNKHVLNLIRKLNIKSGGACFSKKTNNWILNKNNATFEDVYKLLQKTKKIHKLFFRKCKEEVCIWK